MHRTRYVGAGVPLSRLPSFSDCPPPPVNAAGQLDGSPKAEEGAGTLSNSTQAGAPDEWGQVLAHAKLARMHRAGFIAFRDAGMRASAERQRKAAEYHEAWLRRYADSLESGLSLY